MVKTVECKIKGKVQGVFFRRFCQIEAKRLGLVGSAKNVDDGSLIVLARGEENDLLAFINKLKIGPTGAIVRDININWTDTIVDSDNFIIQ